MRRVLFKPLVLSFCAAALLLTSLTACVPLLIGGAAAGGTLMATDRRTTGAQLEDEGIGFCPLKLVKHIQISKREVKP